MTILSADIYSCVPLILHKKPILYEPLIERIIIQYNTGAHEFSRPRHNIH